MKKITTLFILSLSFLAFQNCAQTDESDLTSSSVPTQTSNSSSEANSYILDSLDYQWSDPGERDLNYSNYVNRRTKSFEVNVDVDSIIDAKIYSHAKWTSDEPKEYFSGTVRITIDGEVCTRNKNNVSSSHKNTLVSSSCTKIVNPGLHTIEYLASAWTNHKTVGPELLDGNLSFIVFAK